MARRRAPTPGAQWGIVVEMQPAEKIAIYNRRKTDEEKHLAMSKDEVYSGLLRFVCPQDGSNTAKSHDLHVTSEMTCSDVVPLLCQQLEASVNGVSLPPGHISLVQGEMERVLEDSDKPLEIALECSTKGLASPRFIFRLPIDPLTPDGSPSHRMRTSGFTSYVGALTAHSNPNLAVTPSSLPAPNLSPHLPATLDRNCWLSTDGEQNSLYSTDSYTSLSSPGRPVHRMQHMSKSVSALEQVSKSSPLKRKPMHMLSENGQSNGSPVISSSAQNFLQLPQPSTPQSPSKKMARAKNSVGNFFSRSIRNNRNTKSKNKSKSMDSHTEGSQGDLYIPPGSPEERQASVMVSNLVSPILTDRKIAMSTVIHIHYRDARDALVYKSLLVSHKTKARDVVKEALQRFNLTGADPKDFCLFEVVGHWQDVSQRVELESSLKRGMSGAAALSLSSTSLLTAPRPAVTSVEEFVECYSRPIAPSERPYNLQTYLSTQEGYTRRFELQRQDSHFMASRMMSRSHESLIVEKETEQHRRGSAEVTSKRLSWADNEFCKGASPLFGDTSHRKRGKRQNQPLRSSLSSAVQEGSETEEDILDEVKSRGRAVSTSGNGGEEKVTLRREEVRKSQPDSLLVDEGDPFVPEVSTPRRRKVLLSATSSSPDSGVVSFSKDKKVRHHSDDLSSSARSGNRLESASVFNDTPTHTSTLPHTQLLKTPFLLNLKMSDADKELLVQPLEAERVSITSAGSEGFKPEESEENGGSIQCVCLHHPDLAHDSRPLCLLELQTSGGYSMDHSHSEGGRLYIVHPTHPEFPVHLNGNLVVEPTSLSHGDLLSLYKERYLFLYQDYSTPHTQQMYSWRPQPSGQLLPSSPLLLSTPLPSSPVIKDAPSTRGGETSKGSLEGEDHAKITTEGEPTQMNEYHSPSHIPAEQATVGDLSLQQHSSAGPTPTETTDAACQTPTPQQERRHDMAPAETDGYGRGMDDEQRPGSVDLAHGRRHKRYADIDNTWFYSLQRPKKAHRSRRHLSSDSPVSPVPAFSVSRKSLFSFNLGEEEAILRTLVSELDVSQTPCYLGPALLLAMCTEYCHRCHGLAPTSRFIQKTVDCMQEVVWRCTERLTKWKPDPAMASRPMSHCEDLFPLLQPTVFWLANGLELHHLLTHSCTPLPPPSFSSSSTDPLSTLHSILVYTFQQMFYTVSKVLFYSLPLVLDGCKTEGQGGTGGDGEEGGCEGVKKGGGGEDEIVEQAVDFLQALLDLMTDLQLHLQVVSCFYANLFFFINTTLFNSVMQRGPGRGAFTHSAGTTLRSSLTLLEGWACQVGFKEAVLHHLAKLSSILDILAMPPQQLLQMSWDDLREEFPVLHPAQLHHLLSHYIPPPSLSSPSHWNPSHSDLSAANDRALVNESYDTHPGFTLPEASYSLSLSKTPPQHLEFQTMVDTLHESLRQTSTKNVDVVPVVESAPSAQVPTILTSLPTPPAITPSHSHNHHHHRNHHHKTSGRQDGSGGHRTGHKRRNSKKEGKREPGVGDTIENGHQTLTDALSHESLATDPLNSSHNSSSTAHDVSGIGSNTESQEDLLDSTRNDKNRRNQKTMGEKTNSGSKVADLICSYEETARLSQSSSESVKIGRVVGEGVVREGEVGERGKVGRVMSMVTEHAFSQPQTLILQECNIEEWGSPTFPNGAHFVNIQRGTKGFGILLVEQKDPVTGTTAIFVKQVLPGSTADQCKDLKAGDRVLAIDGQLLEGADYFIAERYLKEAEDDVQLVLAPRPIILTQ